MCLVVIVGMQGLNPDSHAESQVFSHTGTSIRPASIFKNFNSQALSSALPTNKLNNNLSPKKADNQ